MRCPGYSRFRPGWRLLGLSFFLALGCTRANPAYQGRVTPGDPPELQAPPADGPARLDSGIAARADAAGDVSAPPAAPPDAEGSPPDRTTAPDLAALNPDLPRDTAMLGPLRFVLAGSTDITFRGGNGGSRKIDSCPGDEVLTGYAISVASSNGQNTVWGLRAKCGRVDLGSTEPRTVSIGPPRLLTQRGGTGTVTFDVTCPDNQMVVGFTGRSGSRLDQVGFLCATLSVVGANVVTVSLDSGETLGPFGSPTAGNAFAVPCPAGHVARGHSVNDGVFIDGLGLICGRVTPMP
jgi:hypothetical protein